MNKFLKILILTSSLVVIFFLVLEAWSENLNREWQKYQQKYKNELKHLAQNEQDRQAADEYEIKLRQIVIPKLDRNDRCVTCHVAIEDSRMAHMPNPLKSHPGDYLDHHEINEVGCTVCHDGQGRAITSDAAHARSLDQFWEKPLLDKPFIESTCVRCHADALPQTPNFNLGKQLFQQKACFACHSIGDIGGTQGPALSDIGDASFHVKMPVDRNRRRLLEKFNQNVNLAYLYESISEPAAQPEETLMPETVLTEKEILSLMVYLKSLSGERRVMDVGLSHVASAPLASTQAVSQPLSSESASTSSSTGASSAGGQIFSSRCVACHTVGKGDTVGPDLQGVTERREIEWLKNFIQYPSKMIQEKDPIAAELLAKYKIPMIDMGLTDEEVRQVIEYLQNPDKSSTPAASTGSSAAEGTAIPAEEETKASKTVSQSEIIKGAALFQGKQRFLKRGVSCNACHDVRNQSVIGGASLAKELTDAYARLGKTALTAILKNPPFPVMKAAYQNKPLTEDEISALIAFLEKTAQEEGNQFSGNYHSRMLFFGIGGLVVFFGVCFAAGTRRKKKSVHQSIYDRQKKF